MDDLTALLTARLDEREQQLRTDELVALEAVGKGGADWQLQFDPRRDDLAQIVDGDVPIVLRVDLLDAAHIARHNPARVLADVALGRREIAAQRNILDLHTMSTEGAGEGDCWTCQEKYPCDTARLLAGQHLGHENFRPEWLSHAPTRAIRQDERRDPA